MNASVHPSSSEELWHSFRTPLRRFVLSRVRDEATADDILQEIFIKMHTQLSTVRDATRVAPWLFRIASNAVVDHFRQPAQYELDEKVTGRLAQTEEADDSEARIASSLMAMIDDLPESYREAVRLTEVEGLSQVELAERLGISVSGAKSRVQRGREKLRNLLLECCHVELDRRGNVISYEKRKSCSEC